MDTNNLRKRKASIDISPTEFREIGHKVVDQLADFLDKLPQKPVTAGKTPAEIRSLFQDKNLPSEGCRLDPLLNETIELLVENSLFIGHPRFLGYITSSPAPIGALADFIAATINPNVGAWIISPIASEIEAQTVRWIGELIGYPQGCGGLMVSGGNVANFVCFLAARNAKAKWDIRKKGFFTKEKSHLIVYCSPETHAWIEKAVDQYGLGTDSIRRIKTSSDMRMDPNALREQIVKDKKDGKNPFLVVGTAGSTGVGVIDPLPVLSDICKEYNLWFHVDAAYGGFAACLPDAPIDLLGLSEADSLAIDPHKWLYAPLEAGCSLVRDPDLLRDAYSHHPPSYYKFNEHSNESAINYFDYGPQNSRGFRALKVWLALKQVGRKGYEKMISTDIHLADKLFDIVEKHPELEAFTKNLSITTFRYKPKELEGKTSEVEAYLNKLNSELLTRIQRNGELFLSNALIKDQYVLRSCIVNFRTSLEDIEAIPEIVLRTGKKVDAEIRSEFLK